MIPGKYVGVYEQQHSLIQLHGSTIIQQVSSKNNKGMA
jgi:hypothetical protein